MSPSHWVSLQLLIAIYFNWSNQNGGTDVHYHCQERIIEKKGKGRERETTKHLIKIQIFIHTSRVTNFSCMYDIYTIGYCLRDNCMYILYTL